MPEILYSQVLYSDIACVPVECIMIVALPTNVSPFAGMISLSSPVPRVCMPGANQYVESGRMAQPRSMAVPLSSPAGIVTAPLGGEEGPPARIVSLPHIRTGRDSGVAAGKAGAPEECINASTYEVRPTMTITPTAKPAVRPQRSRLESIRRYLKVINATISNLSVVTRQQSL
jgi:hypothetical protein